jgi:hypothetical protein
VRTGRPFRRIWLWAPLVIALAALLILLFPRRTPPKPIANPVHSPTPAARIIPEKAVSHANTAARHTELPTTGAPVVDELCGVKSSDSKRAINETFVQHVMRVTQSAISGWKSALTTSEDPRSQAVGFALDSANPDTPGENKPQDTPVNNRLVLLAIETSDPVIYALALSECGDHGYNMAVGPCQGLSWEHWANIDPDNAAPWFAVAGKAGSSGDRRGVEDALAKASTASHFDTYAGTVGTIALNALPRDMAPLDKAVAGANVMTGLGVGIPTIDIASTLCSDASIQEPTRRQQCTSLTNHLADDGTSVIDVLVAVTLAKRLGLSKDLVIKLQKEQRSDSMALTAHNPWRYTNDGSGFTLLSDFGCDTVRGYDDLLDAMLATGGNQRAALAAVGGTLQSSK